MKKIIVGIVAVILIVVGISYFCKNSNQPASSKEPIKIGVIAPLSGEVASLGENAKNGATLAYDELSENVRQKIQLIFEDDGFQPKNTVSAFNKLVDIDGADVIICFASGPCSSISPLADKKQIPLIAVASASVQKDREFLIPP